MRNFLIVVLFISSVLIAGCISSSQGAPAAVVTPTPQVVYVTVTVTVPVTQSPTPGIITPEKTQAYTPLKTPTPIRQSMQFGGAGDDVRPFTIVGGGGYIVYATTAGKMDNFIVHVTDDRGEVVEYLFNEYVPYSGKQIISLDPGRYYLDIQTGGQWSIDISST